MPEIIADFIFKKTKNKIITEIHILGGRYCKKNYDKLKQSFPQKIKVKCCILSLKTICV